MIQTVEEFEEATLFERLALDRVRPVLGDESTDEIDLRSPDKQGGVIVHVIIGDRPRFLCKQLITVAPDGHLKRVA